MSAILKQLELYQQAAKISAEWSDLVSVEEVAEKTKKSIKQVKVLLNEKGIAPKAQIGKSYMYSKAQLLSTFQLTA